MSRKEGRAENQLRKVKVTKKINKYAEGSCLIEFGDTQVLCTASVEENVPSFLKGSGQGWVTAEYGMLPRSCNTRLKRNATSGRIYEIQRLIGRSLRSVVDMKAMGERTIKIDCDVLQADGGTRTASITGGFIALGMALERMTKEKIMPAVPLKDYVAAVSVGLSGKKMLLDLNYEEDSSADMDMNVVMVGKGNFVEIQGTAEGQTFSKSQVDSLLSLAKKGIVELINMQISQLKGIRI